MPELLSESEVVTRFAGQLQPLGGTATIGQDYTAGWFTGLASNVVGLEQPAWFFLPVGPGSLPLIERIQHAVPRMQDVLIAYRQDDVAGSFLRPLAGVKRTFPCVFQIVDAKFALGKTLYFLNPAAEWHEESMGWRAGGQVIVRTAAREEALIWGDSPSCVQVNVSFGADDATSSAPGDVPDNGGHDSADSLPLVSQRLEELSRLKPNWNSYGAQEINPAVIDYVRSFLEEYGRGATHAPQIVPTNRGGIQIEWHRIDEDLEVQFDSSERGHFFYQDREHGTEIEGELPADLPKLKGILRAMTR